MTRCQEGIQVDQIVDQLLLSRRQAWRQQRRRVRGDDSAITDRTSATTIGVPVLF